MTGPERPGPDEQFAALARDVERATRATAGIVARLDQAEARANQADAQRAALDHDLGDLAETVAGLIRGDGGPPPGSWLDPQPDGPTARELLEDLTEWLARVYLRYHGSDLPSCWMWHAEVVEELLCLRRAHHEARATKTGPGDKLVAWHERARPGVVNRIKDYAGSCELSQHCEGGERANSDGANPPLAGYLGDVAAAWELLRGAPEPTDAMLAAAAWHDRPRSRTP